MRQMEKLSGALRQAVLENRLPKDTNIDRLTATGLMIGVVQKFYEGYFGDALAKNMQKAKELRLENAARYQLELGENAKYLSDFRSVANDMRTLEALTSTDFALGLAWTRANVSRDRDITPPFQTDLLDPEFTTRVTVDSLTPIESRGGVEIAHKFLKRRAESENLIYTHFTATDGFYTVENWELAINYTHETKLSDSYGQIQKAAFRMGVAARRTRALAIVDAIIRKAPRLLLPTAASGPNLDNMTAVDTYTSDMTIGGQNFSQSVTDVFVSGVWKTTATAAVAQNGILVMNGTNIDSRPNPALGWNVHNEQILALVDWAEDYPGLDKKTWFAVDRSLVPFEFATLRGFEAGPQTLVEVPATVSLDLGSFDNHLFRIKVVDYIGADVANPAGVLLVPGTPDAPAAWTE